MEAPGGNGVSHPQAQGLANSRRLRGIRRMTKGVEPRQLNLRPGPYPALQPPTPVPAPRLREAGPTLRALPPAAPSALSPSCSSVSPALPASPPRSLALKLQRSLGSQVRKEEASRIPKHLPSQFLESAKHQHGDHVRRAQPTLHVNDTLREKISVRKRKYLNK